MVKESASILRHVFKDLNFIFFSLYQIEDLEYQKVKVQGRFDHTKEQYIGPR